MKEGFAALMAIVVITVMMGAFAYSAKSQQDRVETVCRTQMLQANRSTEDIIKVCKR